MGLMSAIEFEIEEDERLIPIERSHLMWGRCRCGARALVAAGQLARCSVCTLADAQDARVPAMLAGVQPLGQGYPSRVAVVRETFPAPEVTSRDPWDGSGTPSPVLKLAEKARDASWGVRVQRSRGSAPHATTGRPGAVKWRYALVLSRKDGAWSAYAVHDGASWVSVMLWGMTRAWFPHASVTDLAGYIAAGGAMDDEWYAGIRARMDSGEVRRKQREACNRGQHADTEFFGMPSPQTITCNICGNSWQMGQEPWRKMKASTKEGMS